MAGAAIQSIQTATAPAAPSVEITTPRWLAGSVVLVWLLGLAFVTMSIVAVREHRGALKLIAEDSAKSVIAAERMASALADMDSDAANILLNPQQKDNALKAFERSRELMATALVDAAHNITFKDEDEQIKSLANNSGIYSARVEAAFTLQSTGAPGQVAQYLKAAQLMDTSLLPGARKVDKINRDELDKSYLEIGRYSIIQKILVWATGLGMLAILLRVQFFLSERMRRTLNPLCVLATALTAGLLLYTHYALSTVSHQIELVKSDAFESIHTLWQAKAIAYEANAQESRYLLDKQGAATHETRFAELANLIAADPATLQKAAKSAGVSRLPEDQKGLLADELRKVTFAGREGAVAILDWWVIYMGIDVRIRSLERSGQHSQAVQLCLGEEANQSDWAFNGFISALDKTLKRNQDAFDQAAESGFDALKRYEIIAPVMCLIATLACLFGVLPRIREYSV